MFDDINSVMKYLEEKGALELYGMTEDAEITYRFNLEILEKVMPEFYEMIMKDIDSSLIEMYKLGYVDISYDENLEMSFSINDEGKEFLKEQGFMLEENPEQ